MRKYSDIYVPIDLLWVKFGNKYEGLVKMISEAKQIVELTGDAPNSAIYKAANKLLLDEPVELVNEVVKEEGESLEAEIGKKVEIKVEKEAEPGLEEKVEQEVEKIVEEEVKEPSKESTKKDK